MLFSHSEIVLGLYDAVEVVKIALLLSNQRTLRVFDLIEPPFGSREVLFSQPEESEKNYFIFKIQQYHHS
jgi:hypothetical protein